MLEGRQVFSMGIDQDKCFCDGKFYGEPFSGELLVLLLIFRVKWYMYSHLNKSSFAKLCSVTSAVAYLEIIFCFQNQENSSLLTKTMFSQVKYVFYLW